MLLLGGIRSKQHMAKGRANMEAIKKREKIDEQYKWKLEDIFATDEAWREAFEGMDALLAMAEGFKGRLATSAANLLAGLDAVMALSEKLESVYVYAQMRFHQDERNETYRSMAGETDMLAARAQAAVSFVTPEILEADDATIAAYFAAEPGLALYKHYVDEQTRLRAHRLSADQEELLALASESLDAPEQIAQALRNVDMQFGEIELENGEMATLTAERFIPFMQSENRDIRKRAYTRKYETYQQYKNTFAEAYAGRVKASIFNARARKYEGCLSASLAENAVPTEVYRSLIEAAHEALPLLHRYIRLRKKALQLDALRMYDLYTPIVSDAAMTFTYEEAKQTVLEALAPMGAEYTALLQKGFDERWIDVYENEGKHSGAYSWGAYGTKPYVLLNYQDTLDDMFTLAHEMGHSLHSWYSHAAQAYVNSEYPIFLAEVASTVNEALLMQHLLSKFKDAKTRAYLLNKFAEQFRGTFFRQTMFAEFELRTHEMQEAGKPLTAQSLSALYADLNAEYYGDAIEYDELIANEWMRIPHFYMQFYVYQYATGYAAAIAFSKAILAGGDAVEKYKTLLSGGGADYPLNIAARAGVDMAKPDFVRDATAVFENLLTELETEMEGLQ